MDETAHAKVHAPGWRTVTKFIVRTRSCPHKGGIPGGRRIAVAAARDVADRRAWARANWLMSIYSVVKDPWRGKRQVETSRGRKSYMGAPRECRRKRNIRVKRESLTPLYREEKRAFGVWWLFSLRYSAWWNFSKRYWGGGSGEFSGIVAAIKWPQRWELGLS